MKNLYSNFFIVCFLLTIPNITAQRLENPSVDTILEKATAFYQNTEVFSCELTYTLLRNLEKPITISSYLGKLVKDGGNSHIKISNTEFITVNGDFLKINHDQKRMQYADNLGLENTQNPFQIEAFLKLFASKEVQSKGDYWVCVLTSPVVTHLPYSKAWLFIDKDTYRLEKQLVELFAPKGIVDERGKRTMESKYLEILMTDFKNTYDRTAYLQLDIFINKTGKEIMLKHEFTKYQLIDNSIK